MYPLFEGGSPRSRRRQSLWLAYLGWITALAVVTILKLLKYSQISFMEIAGLFAAATLTHIAGYLLVHFGVDRKLSFDPHFVFVPNWLFFAPLTAYGYYAVGEARDIMLVGWLMGLLFLAGNVRFRGVILTACWYMCVNLGVLITVSHWSKEPLDLFREVIRSVVFLTVCTFFAFLFDRFAAQREYLKASLQTLREKDRVITLLNQKLSKYVTTPVAEQLAKEENNGILGHLRRKITVFFSDIADFSIIADALEAEELAELLNEYFAEMIRIVLKFGGTLDKLMGDGMMVLFGAPESIDPSVGALRSVQMAVNMQERLAVLNDRWRLRGCPYPLRVRMGINTGVNTVGSFGSDLWLNYTAIGTQVNIAARLEEIAAPGEVLMSHSTYSLVADHIEAEKLDEVSLKGPHYPIQAYRLVRFLKSDQSPVMRWQGSGYFISLQPQLMEPSEHGQLCRLLEDFLGRYKESG